MCGQHFRLVSVGIPIHRSNADADDGKDPREG
jgi:hypothetical protein